MNRINLIIITVILNIFFNLISAQVMQNQLPYISDFSNAKLSFDDRYIASNSLFDHSLRIWDVETGKLLENIYDKYGEIVKFHWINGTNKIIVMSRNLSKIRQISIWDTQNGILLHKIKGYNYDYSSKSNNLLILTEDKILKQINAETGALLKIYKNKLFNISDINLSPNGLNVILRYRNNINKLLNLKTENVVQIGKGDSGWSYDSKYVYTKDFSTPIQIWNTINTKMVDSINCKYPNIVKWNPNSNTIAFTKNEQELTIYDVENKKAILNKKNIIKSIEWTRNGEKIAISNGNNIVLLNAINKNEILKFKTDKEENKIIQFSKEGAKLLTLNSSNEIEIWDINKKKVINTLKGGVNKIWKVKLSPDNSKILVAINYFNIKILNANTGNIIQDYKSKSVLLFNNIQWLKDNNHIEISSSENILILNINTGKIERKFNHQNLVSTFNLSLSNNKLIVLTNNRMVVWDTNKSKIIFKSEERISTATFSNNEKYIVSTSFKNKIKIWNSENGTLINTFKGGKYEVIHASFSPNSKMISAITDSRYLKIWDIKDSNIICDTLLSNCGLISLVWIDKNRLVTTSDNGVVKIWDYKKNKLIHSLKSHTAKSTYSLWLNRNKLVTFSDDNTIKIWNSKTGELLHTLSNHTYKITSIDVFNKGNKLISSSYDGSINIWNINTGELIIERLFYNDNEMITKDMLGNFDLSNPSSKKLYFVKDLKITNSKEYFDKFYKKDLWLKSLTIANKQ